MDDNISRKTQQMMGGGHGTHESDLPMAAVVVNAPAYQQQYYEPYRQQQQQPDSQLQSLRAQRRDICA